jgi:hypothetical protein
MQLSPDAAGASPSPTGSSSATAAPGPAPYSFHARFRSREQDVKALQDLSRVMNTDKDEEWMQAIVQLGSLTRARAGVGSAAGGGGGVAGVASPSRRPGAGTGSTKRVSKVYSHLALEHRRALRRHPKIAKWLAKFWRVFFPDAPAAASSANADNKTSPPSSASEPLLGKTDFLTFYALLHLTMTGDAADLSSSAAHDWERMVALRPGNSSREFADILWCLTHIPADYASILNALYCRMTVRRFFEAAGAMLAVGPCSRGGLRRATQRATDPRCPRHRSLGKAGGSSPETTPDRETSGASRTRGAPQGARG